MGSQQQDVLSIKSWLAQDSNKWNKQMRVIRPQQIHCWTKTSSLEGSQLQYGSTQGLGTFQMPQLPVDLNAGYPDRFVRKVKESSPVEQVIGAIQHCASQQHDTAAGEDPMQALLQGVQVVTFRNNLNKIFGTLVHVKDEWVVDACLHGGILYLDIVKLEEKAFDNQDLMTYYGYKFETVCTQPSSPQDPSQLPLVDSTSEFCSLLRLQLDDVGLIMAGEIDLTDGSSQHEAGSLPPSTSYLELKVYKPPSNPQQQRSLVSWKWPKWWLQSFLAGVPTLVLGCRDDTGMLTQVERVQVQTLPGEAKARNATWDAWQMLRFGTDVLRWFRQCAEQQPGQHLRFQYQPGPQPAIRCIRAVPGGDLPERLAAALV